MVFILGLGTWSHDVKDLVRLFLEFDLKYRGFHLGFENFISVELRFGCLGLIRLNRGLELLGVFVGC